MAIKTAKKIHEFLDTKPEGLEIAKLCAKAADDKKASNIVILDLAQLTSFTDYFVICSAPSERQVQAIVRNVEDELKGHGLRPMGIEGLSTSSWVLLDLGSVIFHCFTDSARDYYDLEGFWIDAKRIDGT
ncbi:MAG TPA: ribosome silencing factor [Myxococcota bacterium]|nr:ribosome silencing factor [Myxococcota bacterium]